MPKRVISKARESKQRAAKREDSRLPPGVPPPARPETSRAFVGAIMPLLRNRMDARPDAYYPLALK